MKAHRSNLNSRIGLLAAALLALGATARSADQPTLKEAYQDHFYVGTAINRALTTGATFRRSPEQVNADIARVKQQFNQIVPENELKWVRVHPRPGADG
ncbi:MAG: endo-1,4-beta-xylanase, partial [Verrucomicrobia bacterium]|nr:endo-1,4-beta-xylanase [Verrucomicrobiota bacterium]